MFDNLRNLIAEGKLDKAFEFLGTSNNEVVLLRGRFSRNQKDSRMGLVGAESSRMENARITHALLSLISEMDEEQIPISNSNGSSSTTSIPPSNGKKSIFFSYAHEDRNLMEKIRVHLSPLKRNEKISHWTDDEIKPGEPWNEAIMKRLNSADIILMLISADFFNSEFIWDQELKIAMQRQKSGQAIVVPIILRPCKWEKGELGKLQALPKEGKPITTWDDQDEAILDVVEGIEKLL